MYQQQTQLEHDTGLNAAQAAARELMIRRWLMRIYLICQISGCDVRTALAAIELTDQHPHANQ